MKKRDLRYWSVAALLGLLAAAVLVQYGALAFGGAADRSPMPVEPERGVVSDRSGRILALDSPLYNVAVWRPETDKSLFPTEAQRLASILGIDAAEMLDHWGKGSSDFFYVKKRIQPQMAKAVQDAKAEGSFSGVIVEKISGRLYPEKRLASHVLGFVGDGNHGLAGLESRFDQDLLPDPASAPASGAGSAAGTAPGQASPAVAQSRPSPRGNDLTLTIDADMQFALEEIARKALADNGAQSVMLLAADARTGEILSYVAMPDFDPNEYFLSPSDSWYDWPSVFAYEPGSVFKVFSLASVLDLGGIDDKTTFTCDGAYHQTTPSGEKITIKCLAAHGVVNLEKILEFSCNAGAAYAGDTVQVVDLYDRLTAFGFGQRTGVALPGESSGQLQRPEQWSLRSRPTIAMGQELLVSALQMTQAAVAIADGGVLMKPILVRRVTAPDGASVYDNEPRSVRRVVSAETSRSILAAMETVSSEAGTGKRAKVKDVRMAVKTGTAQMIDPATKRYSETDYIASTLAIFPADDPRVVLYLAIVKPRGDSYLGGRIAAPVIKDAVEAVLGITDIPRGDSPRFTAPATIVLPRPDQVTIGATMPDLTGTPKRLLLSLLSRKDITVKLEGEGYVATQKPAPGAPVTPGTVVELGLK